MTALPKPCSTCGQGRRMSRDELSEWIIDQIDRLGSSLTELTELLNENKIPTLSGGENWYPSTVRSLYMRPKVSKRGGDRWGTKHTA